MKHFNCRSYLGKEKINIDAKRINFLIGHYQIVGSISYLQIFKIPIFQKVGKIYRVLGVQFNFYDKTV